MDSGMREKGRKKENIEYSFGYAQDKLTRNVEYRSERGEEKKSIFFRPKRRFKLLY
jgi:hypothetical protein